MIFDDPSLLGEIDFNYYIEKSSVDSHTGLITRRFRLDQASRDIDNLIEARFGSIISGITHSGENGAEGALLFRINPTLVGSLTWSVPPNCDDDCDACATLLIYEHETQEKLDACLEDLKKETAQKLLKYSSSDFHDLIKSLDHNDPVVMDQMVETFATLGGKNVSNATRIALFTRVLNRLGVVMDAPPQMTESSVQAEAHSDKSLDWDSMHNTSNAHELNRYLNYAVIKGDNHEVEHLLQAGADPNHLDLFGHTPLYSATREKNINCISTLLAHGADINQPNGDGVTALQTAINANDFDIIGFLIAAGANPPMAKSKVNSYHSPGYVSEMDQFIEAALERRALVQASVTDPASPDQSEGEPEDSPGFRL